MIVEQLKILGRKLIKLLKVFLMKSPRSENKIFKALTDLCRTPGYIYAIAYFSLRDNFSVPLDVLPNIEDHSNREMLLRTEISTLTGLLCSKSDIDYSLPSGAKFSFMVKETESLMKEMHSSIASPMFSHLALENENSNKKISSFGDFLREGIFYGPESAYNFQYLDIFMEKYKSDDEWLKKNMGFSISDAQKIIECILNIQEENISEAINRNHRIEYKNLLSIFSVSIDNLIATSGFDKNVIQKLIKSFAMSKNEYFITLSDYNAANTHPLIEFDSEMFYLFQSYTLIESLYESPFYWMIKDKNYKDTLCKNRGSFTEEIAENFLKRVFDEKNVFKNVKIKNQKDDVVGEIDVLVLYADKAIILQAKSKRLTIEARKGNDGIIKDDFKKGIGDAYDQSLSCARYLKDESYILINANNILSHNKINDIFIMCVVCDHYPALSAQVRQLLTIQKNENVFPPLIIDIFFLDILTEFLRSPLYFLSYLQIRSQFGERFIATNELTLFAYHLKRNLWLGSEVQMALIDQSFTSYIDKAIVVRRCATSGEDTPEGILTKYTGMKVGELIDSLSNCDNVIAINLGMLLLRFGEDAMVGFNSALNHIIELASTNEHGDFSLPVDDFETGITVHCNNRLDSEAQSMLAQHCMLKKYKLKASSWYGICLDSKEGSIRFCLEYNELWKESEEIDAIIKKFNL